ncbi:MAG: serine/threonine-protein kinase [Parachlamydiales bacterium]
MPEESSLNATRPLLFGSKEEKPPSYIGPYKIEKLFRKGGMSYLYLALHPKTKKKLILKVLPFSLAQEKTRVAHFLQEARILAALNHPNIVQFYEQGQSDLGYYMALEFIEGRHLRFFIEKKALLPQKALFYVLQTAWGLSHLHASGVIHRDLKPENLLITPDENIKIIDFGIASLNSEENDPSLAGTPNYMSPEQKENRQLSFSSDIYSLGLIAYELLLFKPFQNENDFAALDANLAAILKKTLACSLKERYETIGDFILELSRYLSSF